MSRMSKNFFDEIEDPLWRPRNRESQRTIRLLYNSPKNQNTCLDDKISRNILIVKPKVSNNVISRDLQTSQIKFKSEETLLKKSVIDIAVNTKITGGLRCDTDCVTLVRKRERENRFGCKAPLKTYSSCKGKPKPVQTINYKLFSFTDKACWNHVTTANYGTQSVDTMSYIKKHQQLNSAESQEIGHLDIIQTDLGLTGLRHTDLTQTDVTQTNMIQSDMTQTDLREIDLKQRDYLSLADLKQAELGQREDRLELLRILSNTSNMKVKRWALSHNLTRGPDF